MIGIIRKEDGKIVGKEVMAGNVEDIAVVAPDEQYDLTNSAELAEFNALEPYGQYRGERAAAYPPIGDGLDALVHKENGDEQPWEDYVERCNAVKAQYPKPQ